MHGHISYLSVQRQLNGFSSCDRVGLNGPMLAFSIPMFSWIGIYLVLCQSVLAQSVPQKLWGTYFTKLDSDKRTLKLIVRERTMELFENKKYFLLAIERSKSKILLKHNGKQVGAGRCMLSSCQFEVKVTARNGQLIVYSFRFYKNRPKEKSQDEKTLGTD